jgi:predicted DNA-binding transcriptional regulator YafY
VHAERWWYAFGPDAPDARPRLFRLDRIVSAELLDEHFTVPPDFDARTYLDGGRAFAADRPAEVVVRYAPGAAPYIRERWPGAVDEGNGCCTVRHLAADPDWVVRHVLHYGADAEVLEPPEMRQRVARTAAAMVARWESGGR